MTQKEKRDSSPLVQHLIKLAKAKDRGALAELRRGAGKTPGTEPATFRHVVPFLPPGRRSLVQAWPYFCVASLFALNPKTASQEGFGSTYRRLKESDSRDARFRALINAHEHDLPRLLRQAVRQLAASETPIDWERLLRDLMGWTAPEQYVQRRWALDYWAPGTEETDDQ